MHIARPLPREHGPQLPGIYVAGADRQTRGNVFLRGDQEHLGKFHGNCGGKFVFPKEQGLPGPVLVRLLLPSFRKP